MVEWSKDLFDSTISLRNLFYFKIELVFTFGYNNRDESCCFCSKRAYNEVGFVQSCSCVPVSLTRPFSITKISSASATVLNLCAMHTLVRPDVANFTASKIFYKKKTKQILTLEANADPSI